MCEDLGHLSMCHILYFRSDCEQWTIGCRFQLRKCSVECVNPTLCSTSVSASIIELEKWIIPLVFSRIPYIPYHTIPYSTNTSTIQSVIYSIALIYFITSIMWNFINRNIIGTVSIIWFSLLLLYPSTRVFDDFQFVIWYTIY